MKNKLLILSLTLTGFPNSADARIRWDMVRPTIITPTGIPGGEEVRVATPLIRLVADAARGCAKWGDIAGETKGELEKGAKDIQRLENRLMNLGRAYGVCERRRRGFRDHFTNPSNSRDHSAVGLQSIGPLGRAAGRAPLNKACSDHRRYLDGFNHPGLSIHNPSGRSCGSFIRHLEGLAHQNAICGSTGVSSELPVVNSEGQLTLAAVCPTFHRGDVEKLAGKQFSHKYGDLSQEAIGTESQDANDVTSQATYGNYGSCGQTKDQACRDLQEIMSVERDLVTAARTVLREDPEPVIQNHCQSLVDIVNNQPPSERIRDELRSQGIECDAGSPQHPWGQSSDGV
jgi:hypothetical protein